MTNTIDNTGFNSRFDHLFGGLTRVARLTLLRDQLVAHGPEKFNMDSWFVIVEVDEDGDQVDSFDFTISDIAAQSTDDIDIQKCGTAACLAGHIALLALPHTWEVTTTEEAAKFLGYESEYEPYLEAPDGRTSGLFSATRFTDWSSDHDEPDARAAVEHKRCLDWLNQLIRDVDDGFAV
jgi:hypothetical protein